MKTGAQLKDDVIEELRMVRHVRGVTGRGQRAEPSVGAP